MEGLEQPGDAEWPGASWVPGVEGSGASTIPHAPPSSHQPFMGHLCICEQRTGGKGAAMRKAAETRWFSRRKLLSQHTFDLFSAGSWPSAAEEVAKYLAGIASSSAFSQLHCHTKFSIKWKMENYNPALQVSDLLIQHQLLTYMPAHPPKNKTIHPPTLK